MEKLFWLMWLSDVAGSIGVIGAIAAIAYGALAAVGGICAAVEEDFELFRRALGYGKWLLIPIAVACLTPNSKTIQVLAIASAADAVSSTQLGAKGLEALNAVLDKVIDTAKKK